MADIELLKEQYQDLRDNKGWAEFARFRLDYRNLIRRRAPQHASPLLASYVPNVDIQSEMLEKAVTDYVNAMLINDTRVDVYSLDQAKLAKDNAEDTRIWTAVDLGQANDGNKLSRARAEGQVIDGVACFYQDWKMPPEPDPEDLTPYLNIPDGATDEKREAAREEARDRWYEEYFKHADNQPFKARNIPAASMVWWPLSEPELFIQMSKMRYSEAKRKIKNKKGYSLKMGKGADGLSRIYFVGDPEAPQEYNDEASGGSEIEFYRKAELDRDTRRWKVCDYVKAVDDADYKGGEVADEYDVPYDRAPYFICPSGDEKVTESTPHLRYRPKIYPLLVNVQSLNADETLLMQAVIKRIQEPFYIRMDGMKPELLSAIEGLATAGLGIVEGAGAEKRFVWTAPTPGTDEILTAPRIEAMPNDDLGMLAEHMKLTMSRMAENAPNRFLNGQAIREVEAGTATGLLNQAQAARTTIAQDILNGDDLFENMWQARLEAIAYWDKGAEVEKPFPWRVRGDEPLARDPKEAGEQGKITAKTLETPYVLVMSTKNETQAEQIVNNQEADKAYAAGRLKHEDWLKKTGADDPRKYAEELLADKYENEVEQQMAVVRQGEIRTLLAAFLKINPPPVQPDGTQPQQQTGQQEPTSVGVHAGTAPALGPVTPSSNGVA